MRRWTDTQVVEMRNLFRAGMKLEDIAYRFGGTWGLVQKAIIGTTYADVPGRVTTSQRLSRRGSGGRPKPLINGGRW